MKSLRVIPFIVLVLLAVCTAARGQGTVGVANSPATLFLTNTFPAGSTGPALSAMGPWYYEVLTAPSTVTSVDPFLQQLLAPPWSDTGIQMTNIAIAGRENGGIGGIGTANFWPAGQTNSFIVIGWSSQLAATWAALAPKMVGNPWLSGNYGLVGGPPYYFLGATTVGFRQAGGVVGASTVPTPSLFGAGPDTQGNPITGQTSMYPVNTPEPSPAALLGIALALAGRSKQEKREQGEQHGREGPL